MLAYLKFLNNYYDHIYVITIEPAIERRKRLDELFSGLQFEYFFGADKSSFTLDDVKAKGIYDEKAAIQHHRYSKTMKHGEVACAWSHRLVFENMLAKGYEKVLVFEDDVLPDPKNITLIPEIINNIPADCEFLYWGWAKNGDYNFPAFLKQKLYHLQHTIGLLKWNHKMISNLFAKSYSTYFKTAGFHEYNNAYALTRSAAEKLIKMQTPIQYVADNLTAHACSHEIIKGYIVNPPIFYHETLQDGSHPESYIR